MPSWLKALLMVLIVIVVLVVGVVIAGVYWISRNKDVWIAKGKAVVTEGHDFGRGTDNQGCVDESVKRYKKEPGLALLSRLASSCAPVSRAAAQRQASATRFQDKPNSSTARNGDCLNVVDSISRRTITASSFSRRCSSSVRRRRRRETSVL